MIRSEEGETRGAIKGMINKCDKRWQEVAFGELRCFKKVN